jgi:3-phenylpropionate/trans-cinnamate dioxygenase ferredoxin component
MAEFVEVTRIERIPPGSGARLPVADKDVALFNVDGSLGWGKLSGTTGTCPVHGMKFDVTTGCFAGTSDFGVASYPVKVVDGKIMVALSQDEKTS